MNHEPINGNIVILTPKYRPNYINPYHACYIIYLYHARADEKKHLCTGNSRNMDSIPKLGSNRLNNLEV